MDKETENIEDNTKSSLETDFNINDVGLANDFATSEQEEQPVNMEISKGEIFDEKVTTSEPEEDSGNQLQATSSVLTPEDDRSKMNEVPVQPLLEDSVVFDINSSYNQETSRLNLDTPEEENQEEVEGVSAPEEIEDTTYEEYLQVLQQLQEQREEASQHNIMLQKKLAEYLSKKAGGDDGSLEENQSVSEQQCQYEKLLSIFSELKLQTEVEGETAQKETEELRVQAQDRLHQVEEEWRAFVAVKQDVAVSMLSRQLGKEAAEERVQKALTAQQLQQDQENRLRLQNIKLQMKIQRLEEELGDDEEEKDRDPLLIQFEKLQTERLEQKRLAEKQNEEASKLQKKILSGLEILSYTKNKLQRSQMEVQTKKQQLAELEAEVERRREHLSSTKKVSNSLQRHNQRLKEQMGLLGNRVLLQDFEDTVDASERLEKQLENLKRRQAELFSISGGERKKK